MRIPSKYTDYAKKVTTGKIVAGKLMKLACQRYLDWFKRKDYVFDTEKADRVCNFCEKLTLTTGKFAGKKLQLMDWQRFIIYNLYGFVRKSDGNRVIRQCYLQLARKSSKTSTAAALALYHLIADREMDGQIIFAANSSAQAELAFSIADSFVRKLDPSSKFFKRYRQSIKFDKTKSLIKVVSADARRLDGLNVSMAVIDEYHAAPNNAVADVLESSVGMRTQPLILYITTAGFDLTGPCYEMRNTCVNILEGKLEDDTLGAFIFEMDENDDVEDPNNWVKCQPSLGITVTNEYIRKELRKAKNTPSLFVNFKTKTLNYWCASEQGEWIPYDYIKKSMQKVDLKDFTDYYAYCGVDFSEVSDMTAFSLMWVDDDSEKWIFKNYYYLPSSALVESPNRDLYKNWSKKGYLNIQDGDVIDYNYIINDLLKINEDNPIKIIAYDAWKSRQAIIRLTEEGFNCQPYSQSMGNMSIPTTQMEHFVRSGKVTIDDNPITAWMFSNVVIKSDYNDNRKPVKAEKKSKYKIDGVIAMLESLGTYLSETVYSGEIFTFSTE